MHLLGREPERETLDRLLGSVRAGQSRVLVVSGEAGIGKTALLEHLEANATGCTLALASGVESEMELPFAGLHALCASMLDRLPRLPAPQRAALTVAFGLEAGPPPDRFMVGLAVLSLLADAAEAAPLLCVVDDAQWLDRVSAQTLAFVARRLLAERIGLVFGVRAVGDDHGFSGLPELALAGIGPGDARALLDATMPGRLDEGVRRRILAEAAGNPLALLELPRSLTPTALAGGFGLPGTVPLTSRIEQGFGRRLEPLPARTRRLLLLAAAEPIGDVTLLRQAAHTIGIGLEDAGPAEAAGLIQLGLQVRFRHPLVRSAAYRAAPVPERRAAHRALAAATDPDVDPDRHAWHRAHAAERPDESVAEELARSAGRARDRGGLAAAAAFLARAAELTPDGSQRGARALAAAQAKLDSGAIDDAYELLALARTSSLDELQRAQLTRLHAYLAFTQRRGRDAPPLLLDAARRLRTLDPALARETHLEALEAALVAGRLHAATGVRDAAEAARDAPAAPRPPRSIDLVLDGMATRFTAGPVAGVPPLRRAQAAVLAEPLDGPEAIMRWLSLSQVVFPMTVFELWDDEAYHQLATRSVQLARDTGALNVLPGVLAYLAGIQMFSGDFPASAASIVEAAAIKAATGNVVLGGLGLVAWRGGEHEALERINEAFENAVARGEGRVVAMAGCCLGILNNSLEHFDAAVEGAQRGADDDDQLYVGWSLAELVEGAARTARLELAHTALARLETRTRAAGTDWGLGVLARSRALLSDGETAEALYREAIERLGRTRIRIELTRARLLYGEWLREAQRPADAREHLQLAHDDFRAVGAEAFAARAGRALSAVGGRPTAAAVPTRDALTPQESQIADMAASGRTNPEIGAQLFISPRTVEYHLRKVFTKLDISSRKDLATVLTDGRALETRAPG